MKTLLFVIAALFSTPTFAFNLYGDEFFTDAETIWHDVDAEPMFYHVPGIPVVELNDGRGLYLMTDGFYFHHVIGGRRVSTHEYINKELAIEELWLVEQNYNYFIRRYTDD